MSVTKLEYVSNIFDSAGNKIVSLEHIEKVLSEHTCITKYAYIIHDKDYYSEDEERKNQLHKAGTLKKPHIHLMMKFEPQQQIPYVAKWFGVPENFLEKIKCRRFETAVAYLMHLNAPDKYQYDISEVHSNYDVMGELERKQTPVKLDELLQRIVDGEIKEHERTLVIDNVFYAKHKSKIDNAFKIQQEKAEVLNKDRQMEVIYIWGDSSSCKSAFAKELARTKGLTFYEAGGSDDLLNSYRQEDVILLQELRADTMKLQDLLKLLDNNAASSFNSRYKNKFVNAKMIIITTVVDIDTFYKSICSGIPEPSEQLKRRCKTYIYMTREYLYISQWDNKLMRYTEPEVYKNTIAEKYIPLKELSKEDVQSNLSELIPFLEKADE